MDCKQLDGKPVLVLFLEKSGRTSVLAGLARWNGGSLAVKSEPSAQEVSVAPHAVERDGFAPTVLRKLVGDEKYVAAAERYANEVVWCAPMLVDEAPEVADTVPGFLGGLAVGGNGELYLMQVR